MSEETTDITNDEREYTLDDLSKLAGVTPRTVRYYIVEGLLPPPLTTGRNATYSQEHLDRLNAIGSLKEMYLPLREIRHRLNTLTSEQMRDPAYLASLSQAVAMDRAMGGRRGWHGRGRPEHPGAEFFEGMHNPEERHQRDPRLDCRGPRSPRRGRRSAQTESVAQPASQTWERFPLGDDAELLIRSSKVQNMGPRLYRTLHRLRHMIEHEDQQREEQDES